MLHCARVVCTYYSVHAASTRLDDNGKCWLRGGPTRTENRGHMTLLPAGGAHMRYLFAA